MNYTFCAQTDPGQVRENNEDSVLFDAATRLAVLADGMGGYKAGEVASGMATSLIKSQLARWLSRAGQQAIGAQVRRAMELCVAKANRAVRKASLANPEYAGMGTTLVVAVFQEARLILGHIGDSRCYRWRGNELLQITKDHSLLQEQMDAGLLTPEQAARSSRKNLITRALGVEDTVLLEINELQVDDGDIYLMCSDGLSDAVDDIAMAEILQMEASLEEVAAELVALANENGGRDNITVLLTQAAQDPDKRGFVASLLDR